MPAAFWSLAATANATSGSFLSSHLLLYAGFIGFVLVMLALDLFVINSDQRIIRAREALAWTLVTVVLALAFAVVVFFVYQNDWFGIASHVRRDIALEGSRASVGMEAALQYLTGWIIEYSLSLDNIFVIAVIFAYFRVPLAYQHRLLFWGILGALVMRGAMIWAGAVLVHRFDWVVYVLGGFLVLTAVKMLLSSEKEPEPERNIGVRLARRLFPITPEFDGPRFFTRLNGRFALTPLFLVLIVVETTDVVFAVDSIPAIFAITKDPFLVFTSNVFAILGLRSLYFVLAAMMDKFRYLKVSLVFVLAFVGVKMILSGFEGADISNTASLVVVLAILSVGLCASLLASAKERRVGRRPIDHIADAADAAYRNAGGAARITRRNLKRVLILIAGSFVVLLGIAIAPIPGPGGVPVIIAGLMILATEFLWARRLVNRLREQTQSMAARADRLAGKSSPWLVPPVLLFTGAAMLALAHYGPFRQSLVYMASVTVFAPILYWAYRTLKADRAQRRSGHAEPEIFAAESPDAQESSQQTWRDPTL